MRVRLGDVLRECKRRGILFADNDKETLRELWYDLKSFRYEIGGVRTGHKRDLDSDIRKLAPKYAKNVTYEVENINKELAKVEESITQIMNKISFTLSQMK